MIDIDLALPNYRAFGFPCHGLVKGALMELPNGSTIEINSPQNGDNWLLAVPGAPGAVRTPDESLKDEARGWSWPVDILCWPGGFVHGVAWQNVSKTAQQIEVAARFVYAEAPGRCWFVGMRGVSGGPVGRRLEVSIISTQAPGNSAPVIIYPAIPDGVTGEMLPDHLQLADVSRRGDAAIFRANGYGQHLFVLRLTRADDTWTAELEYIGGPSTAERTGYSAQWNTLQAAIALEAGNTEVLDGAWFWNGDEEPEYFPEYRGATLKTPRVTYEAAVATPQSHPDMTLFPINVSAQDGEVRWNLGNEIVTAWFDDDGNVQLLEQAIRYELTASTVFDVSASGDILISNGTPYYADGEVRPLPAPANQAWEDAEYLVGQLSFGYTRTIRETVTCSLRLNGAEVDSAQLRRVLELTTTSEPLTSTNPDEPLELRGDTSLSELSSLVYRAQMNARLFIDDEQVASASLDGLVGSGSTAPNPEQIDSTLLSGFGYPATFSGSLNDIQVPPVGYLALGGSGAYFYAGVHRYSNKLAAIWTGGDGVPFVANLRAAVSPVGFKPGTEQTINEFPGSSLRGSYNSRTGEAVTDYPATLPINWA
ncbi:hypothetical protein EQ836_23845 [Ectopseudomonas mendocina]|uniref:Tip attachment protein J domain-containing protein n=1 Tax=Ectopseudomonas mendocina TaxID=300 RepID=A0ABD7RPM9_ECTME|nr:hypothetical protein [Pseudomonas mendocina]TRO10163.1 hypothetical protein EQ829_21960 [Pseudomonas mendocina]TRO11730.1 hypothetical protein EQ836_23845 [Pseudomonas mendocina]